VKRTPRIAAAVILAWSAVAQAQTPQSPPPPEQGKPTEPPKPTPPPVKFEFHGFVSGSVYAQDANLGVSEGQHTLYVNAPTRTLPAPNTDRLVTGGDVRQSRFNFSLAGPQVFGGATPKAVLEFDWFGGFGSGSFGSVSLAPRLRLAYAELNWGAHRIQFGQNLDLTFAMAPTSLSHIAQPIGYGTGNIGWRRPGIFGFHTFGEKSGMNGELAWEVGRSQWQDAAAGSAANPPATVGATGIGNNTCTPNNPVANTGDPYGNCLGNASGLPAVQVRLTLANSTMFSAFTAVHWNRVDRSGVNANETRTGGISSDLDVLAWNVGAKAVTGPLTLAATGFTGKNLGPLVGSIVGQFTPINRGDVHEMGGWVQAGYNFTKELSLWGFIGVDKPNRNDATAANFTRLQNVTSSGMLQYRDGGYAIGLEYFHFYTTTRIPPVAASAGPPPVAAQPAIVQGLSGNQVVLSGNYFF
jgi:hypothetical protein